MADILDIDLDEVERLRSEGKTWHDIGLKLAEVHEADPYLLQERVRKRLAKRHSTRTLANGDKTSEVSEELKVDTLMKEDLTDNDTLLKLHGYDPEFWDIVDSSCSIRKDVINTRVKVRPTQRPKFNTERLIKLTEKALESFDVKDRIYPDTDSDDVAEVVLFDIHYARAYREKNHETTRRDTLHAARDIVARLKLNPPKRIKIPVGQDFFNVDNSQGTTTKGTPQRVSLDWEDMYSQGTELMIEIIEMFREVAPVDIDYTAGNHDKVLRYTLLVALKYKYAKSKTVNVNIAPEARVYHEFGNCLVGISHFNNEKDLSSLMQIEAREGWGRTEHHYWLTGHVHHLEMSEKNGVTVFRCPSISFIDSFHDTYGYVGARPAIACFIFNKQGLKEICFGNTEDDR